MYTNIIYHDENCCGNIRKWKLCRQIKETASSLHVGDRKSVSLPKQIELSICTVGYEMILSNIIYIYMAIGPVRIVKIIYVH